MKVWVVYTKGGNEVIGVFTTQQRAAEYYVARYGGTLDRADVQGFDVWQFPPKEYTYYFATAEARDGQQNSDPSVYPQTRWAHEEIQLPADVAMGWIMGDVTKDDDRTKVTTVITFSWAENGLADRARNWLDQLLRLAEQG